MARALVGLCSYVREVLQGVTNFPTAMFLTVNLCARTGKGFIDIDSSPTPTDAVFRGWVKRCIGRSSAAQEQGDVSPVPSDWIRLNPERLDKLLQDIPPFFCANPRVSCECILYFVFSWPLNPLLLASLLILHVERLNVHAHLPP